MHRQKAEGWVMLGFGHPRLKSVLGANTAPRSYMQKRSSSSLTPHGKLSFCGAQPDAFSLRGQEANTPLNKVKA